jgi:hypothetical protein
MSHAVVVTLDLGPERVDAISRIGEREGPQSSFALDAASPDFWPGDAGHEVVLEIFALLHFPVIDTLVLRLGAESTDDRDTALQQKYAGRHIVRDTECRSQQLAVTVRRVLVERAPAAAA